MPLHMATVLTYPERVTEYSLAKLKQRVAAGAGVSACEGGGASGLPVPACRGFVCECMSVCMCAVGGCLGGRGRGGGVQASKVGLH